MPIGTVHFYHCISLTVTLTLAGSNNANTKQNLLPTFPHTLFNWLWWKVVWWWGNSSWTSWDYIKNLFLLNQGNYCCFADSIKRERKINQIITSFNVCIHLYIFEPIWFKLYTMIDTTELYILIIVCVLLTSIQDCVDARRKNLLYKLSLKVINGFRWNLVCYGDFLVLWNWCWFCLVWSVILCKCENSTQLILF